MLTLRGVVTPGDVLPLCQWLRHPQDDGAAGPVVCDVASVFDEDLATVDALARLHLKLRRVGRRLRVRHPSAHLRELIALAGLADVLTLEP